MRTILLACLASTLVLGCTTHSMSTAPSELAARIPALLEEAGVPGLQIAVLDDGRITWTAEYGLKDTGSGAPVDAGTVFQAASLSKPVLAYLALRMAERGALDLDASLYDLLPYERFADVERARLLTPRRVLSHQTGLPNWGGDPLAFEFDPGTRFGYSGEGYVYLQRVIEAQTGSTLERLARREVFEPLGMTDSRFTWEEGETPALATGHDAVGGGTDPRRPEANAASSLHTTARDYARFLVAWLDGEGLGPDNARQAFEPVVRMHGDERGAEDSTAARGKVGWGLGWGTQDHRGEHVVWHWGDNGVFRAFVALRPADGAGVVYLANSVNGLAIAQQLVEPVVGDMTPSIGWLDYRQVTDPTWASRRRGLLAEAAGDLQRAVEHYQALLALDPADEDAARRAAWLTDLLRVRSTPVVVSPERLERYSGRYGPRTLFLENGTLHYQREGREPFELIALDPNRFALDGLVEFRLEIVLDERDHPVKLVGHYLNGHRDESPRTP